MTESLSHTTSVPMVLIVDDDKASRHSLGLLMRTWQYHYQTFDCAEALLDDPGLQTAQCLLVDICLPGEMDGLALQKHLKDTQQTIPFIAMSARSEVRMAVTAARHGAVTFLEKPIHTSMLKGAIESAIEASGLMVDYRKRQNNLEEKLALLTQREREVLDRVVQGQSSAKIALDLGLSIKTVTQHRTHLMQKLKVHGMVGLVRLVTAQPHPAVKSAMPEPVG